MALLHALRQLAFDDSGQDLIEYALLTAIGRSSEPRRRFRVHAHAFGEKDRECGLQAADLLAWLTSKQMVDPGWNRSALPFAQSLRRLGAKSRNRTHVHSLLTCTHSAAPDCAASSLSK